MLPTTGTLFLDLDVSDLRAEGDTEARCAIRAVGMISNEAAEDLLEANGYQHAYGPVWRKAA